MFISESYRNEPINDLHLLELARTLEGFVDFGSLLGHFDCPYMQQLWLVHAFSGTA